MDNKIKDKLKRLCYKIIIIAYRLLIKIEAILEKCSLKNHIADKHKSSKSLCHLTIKFQPNFINTWKHGGTAISRMIGEYQLFFL